MGPSVRYPSKTNQAYRGENQNQNKLPVEVLLMILIHLYPLRHSPPILSLEILTMPALCNAARVCRTWSKCAQGLLFKAIIIDQLDKIRLLHQALDPNTERGRALAEMVTDLMIVFWRPPHQIGIVERILDYISNGGANVVEQLVRRCPNLVSLRLEQCHYLESRKHDDLGLWVTKKLRPPETLLHLNISLSTQFSFYPDQDVYASAAVYNLIINSPSVKSLYIGSHFDPSHSPPVPSSSRLSPDYQLHSLRARQYDPLTQWVLTHSRYSLKALTLIESPNLRQLGRCFPNLTTLKLAQVSTGDSLEEFKSLEIFSWLAMGPIEYTGFLWQLPKSICCLMFRSKDVQTEFQEIIKSGTLPNLKQVRYQDMYYWQNRSAMVMEEFDLPLREPGVQPPWL